MLGRVCPDGRARRSATVETPGKPLPGRPGDEAMDNSLVAVFGSTGFDAALDSAVRDGRGLPPCGRGATRATVVQSPSARVARDR